MNKDQTIKCWTCNRENCDQQPQPPYCFPKCQLLGLTPHVDDSKYASSVLIFTQCFEFYNSNHANCKTDQEIAKTLKSAVNHEMAHVFNINPTKQDGHDDRCEWLFQNFSPLNINASFVNCNEPPAVCALPALNGCLMNQARSIWDSPDDRFTLLDAHDLICGDHQCPCSPPLCKTDHTANCCNVGTPNCLEIVNGSIRKVIDPKRILGVVGTPP